MWRSVLVLLAGCNALLDLDPTIAADAAPQIDGPPDAPPLMCPPIGTAPTFTRAPTQFQTPPGHSYTISEQRGKAIMVFTPTATQILFEGDVDTDVSSVLAINRDNEDDVLTAPAVTSDGNELFVVSTRGVNSVAIYQRIGTAAFEFASTLPLAPADAAMLRDISEPSEGVERHILIALQNAASTSSLLVELEETQGIWNEVRREASADLGLSLVIQPSLSANGLRTVFAANQPGDGTIKLFYRDRASVADPFGTPVRLLATVPFPLFDPVLTDDCARLYYRDASANNALSYVAQ